MQRTLLATPGILAVDHKDALSDPESQSVRELENDAEPHDQKALAHYVSSVIVALERIPGRWNHCLVSLMHTRGWDFVSLLLTEIYKTLGTKRVRFHIDASALISVLANSTELVAYTTSQIDNGLIYAHNAIETALDDMVASFISRPQFIAVVRHVVSPHSRLVSLETTPIGILTVAIDRILAFAALHKSSFQREMYCAIGLMRLCIPWIEDRDSYLVFTGKHLASLKRKRVQWEDVSSEAPPAKKICPVVFEPDLYFVNSRPSDEITSDDRDVSDDVITPIEMLESAW